MSWEDDPRKKDALNIKERRKTKRPRKYKVLFHNDNYTTMEFVIHILRTYFHKSHAAATATMLRIHHTGKGVAGVYTKDVAATKIKQVMAEAQVDGMPLLLTMEPE